MVQLQSIEEELKKCPELRLEDVKALREWARQQPHLPNIDVIPGVFLSLFLRRRYFNLERAKQTLDEYLTFVTLVPEICDNKSETTPEVQRFFETHYAGVIDKTDSAGCVVFFVALHEADTKKYDFLGTVKALGMVVEASTLENGGAAGMTVVYDQKVLSLAHMIKIPLTSITKMKYYNKHCAPVSLKNVYIINANSFVQKILSIFLQPFMGKQTFQKIKIFTASQMDELYKYIPRENVPSDYGGNGSSMKQHTDKARRLLQRHEEYFKTLDTLKVDESKRKGPERNNNTWFSLKGMFRKLNVD